MRASVLKADKRTESRNDRTLGIQTYGDDNDYPQRCKEISDASGTGKSCLRTYTKFIAGRGFADTSFYEAKLNTKGQTADYLLNQVARDMADYGGFALHLNYNARFQIVEVQHVPFETVRFEKLDDEGNFTRVATHPDWGRRNQSLRRFKKEDIEFFALYNPDPEVIKQQVDEAGGWESYNGQVYYYSEAGEKTYPKPIYDPVLTDMSTEEGISNVKNRNARSNFLAAGMLIDKRRKDQDSEQEEETGKQLQEFQTDEKACRILYVQVESEEEIPEFVSFKGENYDKEFEYSENSVQQNIGQAFSQPPILRAKDVGASFGADLMTNAYNYYSAVTEPERLSIERVFAELFVQWPNRINPSDNYSILPLQYNYAQ